jgi:hypothetical protein
MTIGGPESYRPTGPGVPAPASVPDAPEAAPTTGPARATPPAASAAPAQAGDTVNIAGPTHAAPATAAWPAYGELFGHAGYVQDPADAHLKDLATAAVAADPALAAGPLGQALKAGRLDAPAIKALQQALASRGYDLGPAGVDGLYGPKTHAALVKFLEAAEHGPVPHPPVPPSPHPPVPPAPHPPAPPAPAGPGAPAITGTRFDPTYQLGHAPPAGYHAVKGGVPAAAAKLAHDLLGKPFGTETYFELDGKRYVARNEPHYHPPGFVGGPTGWHQGVTIYAG